MKKVFREDLIYRILCIVFYAFVMFCIPLILNKELEKIITKDNAIMVTIIFEVLLYLILVIGCVLLMKKEIVYSYRVSNKTKISTIFLYAIIGLVFVYIGNYMGSILSAIFNKGETNSENQVSVETIIINKNGWIMFLTVSLIGPIVEELVFRGAILRGLVKLKVPGILAIIISSMLFGLMHVIGAGDFGAIFPYIFAGLTFGFVYYLSDSIITSIIVHASMNTIAVCMLIWLQFYRILIQGKA